VSHHPPVSAFYSESTTTSQDKWKCYGSVNPKIKFWGKSIEVTPKGSLTLELEKFNETYTWQTVTCCVHNIIVGKLWFEYYGTMEITCHQTGYKAILNFKPYSWSNKELNKVEGHVYDKKKNKLKYLYGYWTHCLYSCDQETQENYKHQGQPLPMIQLDKFFNPCSSETNSKINVNKSNSYNYQSLNQENGDLVVVVDSLKNESVIKPSFSQNKIRESGSNASLKSLGDEGKDCHELWRAVPRPKNADEYYNFNYFSMMLNELKEDFENKLAPTDSRFRSDIKQLELGDLDGASSQKVRLEEKQRESRTKHGGHKAKWFNLSKHPINNEETWLFNNKYWLRDYSDCPELY
jgi:hypothetical protein